MTTPSLPPVRVRFYTDGSGYVVHYSGLRLQGYTNAALIFAMGDVQIDAIGAPAIDDPGSYVEDFAVGLDGVVTEYLSDGSTFVRGQVLLAACSNPDALVRSNFDLYPLDANPGLWSPVSSPQSGTLGWLVSGDGRIESVRHQHARRAQQS